ncbi:Spy/CpxP family protein refolding chaperone [Ottowia cancrivicina]|uniref:Spy/CpxP family protein refolding chaperone n=1 Tax=Ottowia cancrivicina TaxID=3040346 RepID=A0AAW6RNM1_9BURK|nr:Spy/CpxP family protein refolding chaperone [Ottowia sp. 10c7w1]MDG9700532.1 Spy/CpxP family protein refolding chaperone [Ottowia sp. 10c7w1]
MLQRSKSWLAVALMAAAAAAATAQTSMPASGEASAQASEQRANPREADRHAERRAERHAKRMADLKQRLQIISAQEGAWNQLVSAMQPPARQPEQGAGRNALERLTTPKRLDRMQAMQTERQNRMAARNQAIKQFYSQLSAEQQKVLTSKPRAATATAPSTAPIRHAAAKAITAKATAANTERGGRHPPRGMTAMRLTLLRQAFFWPAPARAGRDALRFQEQIKGPKNASIARFDGLCCY